MHPFALSFQYQARLRLPDTLSHSQKMQCVDHIIEVLDLGACQDTSEYTCIIYILSRATIGPLDGLVLFSEGTLFGLL